ncbi:MAG: EI24 domain-containing protein [Gemmobacter sp.]
MLGSFLSALGQIGDPRFRRVMLWGVLLSVALLVAVYAGFLMILQAVTPDAIDIPLIGPVTGLHTLLSWASALFMIGLSVFLMVPVASAFCGLFLEDVAQAVEDRHYPHLPPVARQPLGDTVIAAVNFVALVIGVNLGALMLVPFAGPLVFPLFWAANGYLLGREYFTMAAARHLGLAGARALRRRHGLRVFAAGLLMAVPLSVPLVNLAIPVLGAATFTHLFHRLAARGG